METESRGIRNMMKTGFVLAVFALCSVCITATLAGVGAIDAPTDAGNVEAPVLSTVEGADEPAGVASGVPMAEPPPPAPTILHEYVVSGSTSAFAREPGAGPEPTLFRIYKGDVATWTSIVAWGYGTPLNWQWTWEEEWGIGDFTLEAFREIVPGGYYGFTMKI